MNKTVANLPRLPLVDVRMGDGELKNLEKVIKSGWVTEGPQTKKFEAEFASFIGTKYAVATSSCTSALQIMLDEYELTKEDDVITTNFTWSSTVSAILYAGATPVFADIDPKTFNISPNSIIEKVTEKTRGIVVVHYAGLPCEMDKIKSIAEKYDLFVVEDSAHALGSEYKGNKTGRLGDAAAFSFGSTKIITTGEGGMITTDDEEKHARYKILRNYGETKSSMDKKGTDGWKYDIQLLSYNYKINEFASAIGIEQMKKLPSIISEKTRALDLYRTHLLRHDDLQYQKENSFIRHVPLFFPIFLKNRSDDIRSKIMDGLAEVGIESSVYYPTVSSLTAFKKIFKESNVECPAAEKISGAIFSIPCNRLVTKEHIQAINEILSDLLE